VRPSHRDKAAIAGLLLGCGLVSAAMAPAAQAAEPSAPSSSPAPGPVMADLAGPAESATYGPLPEGGPLAVDDDPLPIPSLAHGTTPAAPAPAPAAPRPVVAVTPAFGLPVHGYYLSARFDERGSHWGGGRHTGLDFVVPSGTRVHAVAAGRVVDASWDGPYGRSVIVGHADGTQTRYAHMSAIGVEVGDRVAVGATLGRSGASGNVTGAHLHLEVVVGGTQIDPCAWLKRHGVRA
jgi:murein DD-endopeptidase MepM/ murein hydrolase activator NlpD